MAVIQRSIILLIVLLLGSIAMAQAGGDTDQGRIIHPGSVELHYLEKINRPPPLSSPLRKVRVAHKNFYVLPGVVAPSIQSVYLLEHSEIRKGETVLDLGTGCGVQAIFAADKASRIVATDLSHTAVENAKFNVRGHALEHKIEVHQGDLFRALKSDEKFDVILFNIDYPYNEKTRGLWKVHERFFKQVTHFLQPNGRIYYQFGFINNLGPVLEMIEQNDLRVMQMNMASALLQKREPIVMLIQRKSDTDAQAQQLLDSLDQDLTSK